MSSNADDTQEETVRIVHPKGAVPLIIGTDDICFVLKEDGEATFYAPEGDIMLSQEDMVSLFRGALIMLGMVNDVIDADDEDEDEEADESGEAP